MLPSGATVDSRAERCAAPEIESWYTNWLPGEPTNGDNAEDCVQFCSWDDGASFGWNDMPCDLDVTGNGGLFALCRMDYE